MAAALLIAIGFWHWALNILAPANTATVRAAQRPIGNNSDLYPRWLGARELLLHGRDPYSPEVTREIQTGFYGRPLDPQNPQDPTAKESFVYPLYVVFLLAPFVTLPFPTVVEIFRCLVLVAVALSVPLWIYAARLRPGFIVTVCAILLTLSSFPAVEEYFQQNLTAIVILFLSAAATAAVRNWLTMSGFLLAWAMAKPDISLLVVLWFLLWAAGKWKERQRLIYSFAATLTTLMAAAEILSPHWVVRFLAAVREYPTYGTDPNILNVLLPLWLARLTAAVLFALLLAYCWKWRRTPSDSQVFAWALACVVTVTLVVLPKLAAYNELLLLPVFIMLFGHRREIAKSGLLPRALTKAAFASLAWPWATATLLAITSFWMSGDRLRNLALVPLYTLLAIPAITLLANVSVVLGSGPLREEKR